LKATLAFNFGGKQMAATKKATETTGSKSTAATKSATAPKPSSSGKTNSSEKSAPSAKATSSAKASMERFKTEVASELGVNLKSGYNGNLTSREAGSIGGEMVRRMIKKQKSQME
jgi:hypothetical protein